MVVPICTVEEDVFCAMIEALSHRYQLPHKDFFSRTAIPWPELYDQDHIAAKVKKRNHGTI